MVRVESNEEVEKHHIVQGTVNITFHVLQAFSTRHYSI